MKLYKLQKSNKPGKKFMVSHDGKTVHFGAKGMSDYTIHKDHDRMIRYNKRHAKNENWSDLSTPGAWAKNLLWNKTTIRDSIRDIQKRFDVRIVYKR